MVKHRETILHPIPETARHVADGRVFVELVTERYPEATIGSLGILVQPDKMASGDSFENKKGDVLTADKRIKYGRVTGCGIKCDRNTTRPFTRDEQGHYPLPAGTLVKIAVTHADYKVSPTEMSYSICDILEYTLPHEPRPIWAPEA